MVKSLWSSFHHNNYFIVKLGVSILLVGLAFRLLFNRSSDFSQVSETPFLENPKISENDGISLNSQQSGDRVPSQGDDAKSTDNAGKCNLFSGNWIPYPGEPFYTNDTCKFIEEHQNCMKNGRPDTGYLHWQWKPMGCDLPRFDPKRFLETMRNKNWALIGDSISRNHVQSILCMLSTVENAVLVHHDKDYKTRRWIFPSYNLTISIIWSPFLAKADIFEDMNGVSSSEIELHLDRLDPIWTVHLPTFDYIIFSSGKWFVKSTVYYEKGEILGCHYCPKRNLTELGLNFAFPKVIRNVFNHLIESNHKGTVFYRTLTPDHFEKGQWFNGGSCERTVPSLEGEFKLNDMSRDLHGIELEEFEKAEKKGLEKGVKIKLFDVTSLSLLRPDGHPGPYRHFHPFAKDNKEKVIRDCLHWCLPGPIDSWNDLLMEMVVNG